MTRSCGTSSQNQVAAVSVACSIFRPPFDGRGGKRKWHSPWMSLGLFMREEEKKRSKKRRQMRRVDADEKTAF
jgi:hypothetical protein